MTDEEILRAIAKAKEFDDVQAAPDGYEIVVDASTANGFISGGEYAVNPLTHERFLIFDPNPQRAICLAYLAMRGEI